MFDAIRRLVTEFGEGHRAAFAESDYRLAAAALLVHVAEIDGAMSQSERDKLHALIKDRFALNDEATEDLVEEAIETEHEAVDFFHFTTRLNRALDEDGRQRIVEMMWDIAFVDGRLSEFEDNLIWRAADLLGVSSRARIALRERVAGETNDNPGDDKDRS